MLTEQTESDTSEAVDSYSSGSCKYCSVADCCLCVTSLQYTDEWCIIMRDTSLVSCQWWCVLAWWEWM